MSRRRDVLPPADVVVVSRQDLANLVDVTAHLADWCEAIELGDAPGLLSLDYGQIAVQLRSAIARVVP